MLLAVRACASSCSSCASTIRTPPILGQSPAPPVSPSVLYALLEHADAKPPEPMAKYCCNPSRTMILFLLKRGGTYLFRKTTGEIEPILHAKLILPAQITRFTYSEEDGAFILWAGDRKELSFPSVK